MNVAQALKAGEGIDPLDREVLLAHVLNQNRAWLIAHADDELSEVQESQYKTFIDRRVTGEPAAYIVGEKEFYGRMFYVSPATLIPRPATELLVEQTLKVLGVNNGLINEQKEIDTDIVAVTSIWKDISSVKHIVDIGTGSGCIAVTLACERPDLHIIATDISDEALQVARKNAAHHGVDERIDFRKGSVFDPIQDLSEPFLIVSNPPYIPVGTTLEKNVQDFEPHLALFSGKEGTDIIHALLGAARINKHCVGYIIECKKDQVESPSD